MMSIHGRVINRPHLIQVTCICTVNDSCFIGKYLFLFLNPFTPMKQTILYTVVICCILVISISLIQGRRHSRWRATNRGGYDFLAGSLGSLSCHYCFDMALGLQDSPRTIASNNKPGTRRNLRVKSPIYATPLMPLH